ncbi:hypothetical protein PROFUN_08763 [Planoprotostelium fungivorum]|uniref:Uncharacterized protein n=1 Tax=Planoprotostelium fungivorum TaxID=1890364 RepID=A0A2P6MVP1_9EUKA|nr:hypothetical protein PROFUN_08763 [Planoprotostelium fungivorum]
MRWMVNPGSSTSLLTRYNTSAWTSNFFVNSLVEFTHWPSIQNVYHPCLPWYCTPSILSLRSESGYHPLQAFEAVNECLQIRQQLLKDCKIQLAIKVNRVVPRVIQVILEKPQASQWMQKHGFNHLSSTLHCE